MSDILAPATPFPPEGSAPPPAGTPDPLAGDWSEGLRGPLRALGIPEPKLLSLEGMAQPPAPVRQPVESPPSAPAEAVEAPAGWAAPSEDPLHSQPHHPAPIPSVIVDITPPSPAPVFLPETPPSPAPAFLPEMTPPSPAPAFAPEVTPAFAAPAFLPEVTPAVAAPAFSPETTPPSPAPAFEPPAAPADSAPTPWSDPAPPAAAETAFAWDSPPSAPAGEVALWSAAPETGTAWSAAPVAVPAAPEVGSWDQVTAANVPAPALIPPPPTGWEAPAPAAAEVVATEDVIWSAPPPAEPAEDWKAEAPSPDWQEVKSAEAPAPEAPADWSTLNSGPDWSTPPLAEPAAAEPAWDAAAPPPAESQWEAAPAAPAEVESEWVAPPPPPAPAATDPGWSPPADQSTEWAAPAEPAPGPAWNAPAVGASALEQLDSDPIEAVPGAAQDLFGSVPDGGSLAGDDEFGPPEELASAEDVLKAIPQEIDHHDPDLPVPVDDGPARPRPVAMKLAQMRPASLGALEVPGEHRVAVHTRGGRTRRGTVKDIDLAKSQFSLVPQGGGEAESIYHAEVKAIFFMLAPGEKYGDGDGGKVRVTFADGRTIEGMRDGADAKHGFFLVPIDAAKTNTRRIYIAREATSSIKDE